MADDPSHFVALALGSNLGDRVAHLRAAVAGLAGGVEIDGVSSVYASAPEGHADQPDFLNAVVVGRTRLNPVELLARAHALEAAAGRRRSFPNAPRPLDVDVVFYGSLVREAEPPLVPHPRWDRRAFVLAPLAEVAPDAVDPRSGRTVETVWNEKRADLRPTVTAFAPPEALRERP